MKTILLIDMVITLTLISCVDNAKASKIGLGVFAVAVMAIVLLGWVRAMSIKDFKKRRKHFNGAEMWDKW